MDGNNTKPFTPQENDMKVIREMQKLEVLSGKVVKFLLTRRGSDAFDPSYGGIALHHANVSRSYLPKLAMELADDISRCTTYIAEAEKSLPQGLSRLSRINIIGVQYDESSRDTITVRLEIITTKSEKAYVVLKDTQNA